MVRKANSFEKLIISQLMANKKNTFMSRIMLVRNISNANKQRHTKNRLRFFIKRSLTRMESKNLAVRRKQSYRLTKKVFERLLKKDKKYKKTKQKKSKNSKIAKKKKIPLKTLSNPVSLTTKTKKKIGLHSKILSNPAHQSNPKGTTSNVAFPPINIQTSISAKQPYQKRYNAIWQFYDPNNINAKVKVSDGWYDYDDEASDIVEDEWQRYIVNRGMNDVRAVKSGQWEYMVDFINWKQTNTIHQNHKVRQVRRLDEKGNVTENPYL